MSRIDCEDSKATLQTCYPVYLTKKCCMAPGSDNSRFKFLSKLAISNTFKVSFSNYVLFRNNSKPHVYRAAKLKLIHKHSFFACFFFFTNIHDRMPFFKKVSSTHMRNFFLCTSLIKQDHTAFKK